MLCFSYRLLVLKGFLEGRGNGKVKPVAYVVAVILLQGLMAMHLEAATYYVDPNNGKMSNDGSYDNPWKTLQGLFDNELIETQVYQTLPPGPNTPFVIKNPGAPVKAGDTILLRSGYHGEVDYRSAFNSDYITIAAQDGHKPYLKSIMLESVSKWILCGLTISPALAPGSVLVPADLNKDGLVGFDDFAMFSSYWRDETCEQTNWCRDRDFDRSGMVDFVDLAAFADNWLWEYGSPKLVFIESHNSDGQSYDVIIENNTLFSIEDSSNWSGFDWDLLACTGIHIEGRNMIARNNTLTNVNHGIHTNGDDTLIENNTIKNVAGDGVIAGANDVTIQYNMIKNFYKVNNNHDDGIQFHRGLNIDRVPMMNAVIRGNIIISHDPHEQNPLVGSMAGIVCFDKSMSINWLVENNVVLVQHGNGIVLEGAIDSTVVNNIVFDPTGEQVVWVSFQRSGSNTVVRNNMANHFALDGENMIVSNNLDIDDYGPNTLFLDHENHDMRHKPGSPAIDAGSPLSAPSTDIEGNPRPYGLGYDIGAYEYTLPTEPIGGGLVNFKDFALFASYWQNNACGQPDWCGGADFDQSGMVDVVDLMMFAFDWLSVDIVLNFKDFAVFASYWQNNTCEQPDWCGGVDFDRSGMVDSIDLMIFANDWLSRRINCWDDQHQKPVLLTSTDDSDLSDTDGQWTEYLYTYGRYYPSVLAGVDEEDFGLPVMRFYASGIANGEYEVIANLFTAASGRDMRYYYGYTLDNPKALYVDTVGGAGGLSEHQEYSLGTVNIAYGTFNIYVQDADLLGGTYPYFGWAWIRLVLVTAGIENN